MPTEKRNCSITPAHLLVTDNSEHNLDTCARLAFVVRVVCQHHSSTAVRSTRILFSCSTYVTNCSFTHSCRFAAARDPLPLILDPRNGGPDPTDLDFSVLAAFEQALFFSACSMAALHSVFAFSSWPTLLQCRRPRGEVIQTGQNTDDEGEKKN